MQEHVNSQITATRFHSLCLCPGTLFFIIFFVCSEGTWPEVLRRLVLTQAAAEEAHQ